jgi:hypothetical protein
MSKEELRVPTLKLTKGDTCRFQLVQQLDLDDVFKTLGIHKTISGDQSVQITEMKKKSDDYARAILPANEAWTGLFSIWLGKMNYPLLATSLTRRQCKKIQFTAINASLSKCRYSRKTPCAIVFLAPWFDGLGWQHLFFEQGIQHVLLIIKHLRAPGPFQSLLQISLQ